MFDFFFDSSHMILLEMFFWSSSCYSSFSVFLGLYILDIPYESAKT